MKPTGYEIPLVLAALFHACILVALPGVPGDRASMGTRKMPIRLRIVQRDSSFKRGREQRPANPTARKRNGNTPETEMRKKRVARVIPSGETTALKNRPLKNSAFARNTGMEVEEPGNLSRKPIKEEAIREDGGSISGQAEGIREDRKERVPPADKRGEGGDMGPSRPPAVIYLPEPEYPLDSRRAGEEGLVLLSIRIDEKGRGSRVEVLRSSGFERLDVSAKKALAEGKFNPAMKGGIAVRSIKKISVKFKLEN